MSLNDPFRPTPKTSDFVNKATDQAKAVAERVEDATGVAAAKGRQVVESVDAVTGNMKRAVDKSIKEQPMATLAIAAAIGFLLGALWKL